MIVALNATPVPRPGWRIGVPHGGVWREVLNTDAAVYAGSGVGNAGAAEAVPQPWQDHPFSIVIDVPPLAAVYFMP